MSTDNALAKQESTPAVSVSHSPSEAPPPPPALDSPHVRSWGRYDTPPTSTNFTEQAYQQSLAANLESTIPSSHSTSIDTLLSTASIRPDSVFFATARLKLLTHNHFDSHTLSTLSRESAVTHFLENSRTAFTPYPDTPPHIFKPSTITRLESDLTSISDPDTRQAALDLTIASALATGQIRAVLEIVNLADKMLGDGSSTSTLERTKALFTQARSLYGPTLAARFDYALATLGQPDAPSALPLIASDWACSSPALELRNLASQELPDHMRISQERWAAIQGPVPRELDSIDNRKSLRELLETTLTHHLSSPTESDITTLLSRVDQIADDYTHTTAARLIASELAQRIYPNHAAERLQIETHNALELPGTRPAVSGDGNNYAKQDSHLTNLNHLREHPDSLTPLDVLNFARHPSLLDTLRAGKSDTSALESSLKKAIRFLKSLGDEPQLAELLISHFSLPKSQLDSLTAKLGESTDSSTANPQDPELAREFNQAITNTRAQSRATLHEILTEITNGELAKHDRALLAAQEQEDKQNALTSQLQSIDSSITALTSQLQHFPRPDNPLLALIHRVTGQPIRTSESIEAEQQGLRTELAKLRATEIKLKRQSAASTPSTLDTRIPQFLRSIHTSLTP